jgi:hypothetical protein
MNIYAPNIDINQLRFFKDIKSMLENIGEDDDKLILGGDLNVIFDPDKDRKGGNFRVTNSYVSVIDVLDDIIENNKLCDIWRTKYPDQRSFTWRQRRPEIHSRLDVWLISDTLQDFVKDVEIKPSIRSDHSSILLRLDSFKTSRGHGYWKLNNSMVEEYDYIKLILDGFNEWIEEIKDIHDDIIKWEYIKYKIRLVSIIYGKTRKKRLDTRHSDLENKLDNMYKLLDFQSESNEENNLRLEVEAELKELDTYKTEGLIMRSKCRWYEKGEKSNNCFLRLINRNKTKTTMNKLKMETGEMEINPDKILKMQANFYETLYSEDNEKSDIDMEQYLNNIQIPKLDEECINVIRKIKKGKTPGIDGITIEFYSKFWHLINNIMIKSFNASYNLGELSETQKRGIITLLDKGKDRTLLQNWRPITLLNVDYKILSKVLAERMKQFLPKLINHNQVGYVKGRNIIDNIRTVSDLLFLTKNENIGGMIIGIDFKKAFDSVNWNFLTKTLKHYNFGDFFIKWVKTLYRNSSSCIINNGRLSSIFQLGRGVRQGHRATHYHLTYLFY